MVRAKYGSIPGLDNRTDRPPLPRDNTEAKERRRQSERWWNRAAAGALMFSAAVLGVTMSFHPENSAPTSASRTSLTDVVTPTEQALAEPAALPRSSTKAAVSRTPAAAAATEIPPLSFEALNFYHVRDGKPAQDYPWLKDMKLIEPYRNTTLSVSSPRDGHEYLWEVRVAEGDATPYVTARGREAVVILTVVDNTMVTLTEVSAGGEVVRQLDELVMVKYVRREIRTLTDEEREELLDAMYQLWAVRVDGGNGLELYGDDYADIYAIQRLHFQAAMNPDCDHFHDGVNFLTSHVVITNTFEYSLQKVNPKISVPYWDWTIEEYEAEKKGAVSDMGGLMIDSPLFQESWFGTADPDDYKVKDGRWANTIIPMVYHDDPGNLNPDVYGRLRSSFNVNDSPILTRGLGKRCEGFVTDLCPWPSCSDHYSMVTEHPDFYSWVWTGQCTPHGNVHQWIAGVLNCEDTLGSVGDLVGLENALALGLANFDTRKKLWIFDWFTCESESASTDESLDEVYSSGKCGCLDYDLSQGDDWKTLYYNSTIAFDTVLGDDYDDETKREVIAAVCTSTSFLGDHSHGGSSLDPTFWPMHGTMERLFMYSVVTGTTTDFSWPDEPTSTFETLSTHGDKCTGHRGSDVFPYGLSEADGFKIKTGIRGNVATGNAMTNRDILAALDIRTENVLPYVYDTFKWDHCLELGYDFDDAWE